MASAVSSLYFHCATPAAASAYYNSSTLYTKPKGTVKYYPRQQQSSAVACCCIHNNNQSSDDDDDGNSLHLQRQLVVDNKRRQALFQMAFTAFSSSSLLSFAAFAATAAANEEDFRVYMDDTNKYKIMIPQDWQVGEGQGNGIKAVTAFTPPVASESNVSVLITGLGADFTRLESFGKVDSFAETLVSGLDRSWQRPPGVVAKLIDCKASKGFYYIEYSLQNPGESRRHIFTTIGMASNGWYNRLYTVTGQFLEEDAEKYGSQIEKSVSSFRFT